MHVDDCAAVPRERLRAESRANTVSTVPGAEAVVNRAMPQEQHREGAMLTGPVSERRSSASHHSLQRDDAEEAARQSSGEQRLSGPSCWLRVFLRSTNRTDSTA